MATIEEIAEKPAASIPVAALVEGCVARWWACPTTPPDLGRRYSPAEQTSHERQLTQMAEALGTELERGAMTPENERTARERYTAEASRLAQQALGFSEGDLALMRMDDFADMLVDFARQARRFDTGLSAADVMQAGRNVMSAGLLQLLLGRPLALTPAIMAYSLLYPYSDNVLDDPALSPADKRAFNRRFQQRLTGQPLAPANDREAAIDRLVALVEGQFERERYPRVYASLLAIHAAQTRSLELLQASAAPYEVDLLGLTFDKGGTSVLADAYLAAGELSAEEEVFAFELGAFLQCVDDLEDVEVDRRAGRLSVYALAAGHWRLDALTNRTVHFGMQVLSGLDQLPGPDAAARRSFLERGLSQAVIQSAGRARRSHSHGYTRELEAHTPFRFAFVEGLTRRLSRTLTRAWPRLDPERAIPDSGGAWASRNDKTLARAHPLARP
jgi:hypothetical protein